MALLSALGIRSDPILGHNFVISLIDTSSALALATSLISSAISDVALGGFTECTGLEMSLEIKDYEEGGNNAGVLKFPTRVKWSNITLKKGVGSGTALWDWHYGFVEGSGRRRDGVIMLMDDLSVPNHIWYFKRGLPIKYTGPSMNASQNNVAIEAIEIAHEGIYQLPGVGLGAAALSAAASISVSIG
jgi:phage tail-like protein